MVSVHRSGHCSNEKVSNGQVYDKVGRAFTQVTISCESKNGKTVYNECHSQFNDKDCEPLGLEQWTRRSGSCFIAHSRVSRLFQGASVIFAGTVSALCVRKRKRIEIFSKFFVWKNCIGLRAERTKDAVLSKTTRGIDAQLKSSSRVNLVGLLRSTAVCRNLV